MWGMAVISRSAVLFTVTVSVCPLLTPTPELYIAARRIFEETFVFREVSVLTLFRQESAETIRVGCMAMKGGHQMPYKNLRNSASRLSASD